MMDSGSVHISWQEFADAQAWPDPKTFVFQTLWEGGAPVSRLLKVGHDIFAMYDTHDFTTHIHKDGSATYSWRPKE